MKYLGMALVLIFAFISGILVGWDNGVDDGKNLYQCNTTK